MYTNIFPIFYAKDTLVWRSFFHIKEARDNKTNRLYVSYMAKERCRIVLIYSLEGFVQL